MNFARALNVTRRILRELRNDRRSLIQILVVPTLLLLLFGVIIDEQAPGALDKYTPALLSVFPMTVVWQLTSISFVRERTEGTLERLMVTPATRGEIIAGYLLGYGTLGLVSTVLSVGAAIFILDIPHAGNIGFVFLVVLGLVLVSASLGILVSAASHTEFQAIQGFIVVIAPQTILGGGIVPADSLPAWLEPLSYAMPLRYATEALEAVLIDGSELLQPELGGSLLVITGFVLAFLALATRTIRRQIA
jgi:ABC-2 type transport system permease protein